MDKVTPKCPYCGTGMEISKYDVQEGGVIGYQYFCEMCDGTSPIMETKDAAYAAAMRRYQPENRVLTLLEVLTLDPDGATCIEDKASGEIEAKYCPKCGKKLCE